MAEWARTLAKAFTLVKAAIGCTEAEAMQAALDPQSKARRLLSYGGRFTQSVENFRAGLALLDKFADWYDKLVADFQNKKFDTVTKANAGSTFLTKECAKAYEIFLFQDLAISPDANLNETDPEKLFGAEHNNAMNFFVRGNGSGCTATVLQMSPAKRQVVYAVFKALLPPVTELGKNAPKAVHDNEAVISRVLRHYDKVLELIAAGKLDRPHLNALFTPDLGLPPDATPQQVSRAIEDRYYPQCHTGDAIIAISLMLTRTGCTVTEAMAALQGGDNPAQPAEVAATTMKLNQIDGTTKGGRDFMLGDLVRPENVKYLQNGQPVIAPENKVFKVIIDGQTHVCATRNEANNVLIADKIEEMCGKVHVEQANTVMRGLSQGGHTPLLEILPQHGIRNGVGAEHMPLTYTLSKNEEIGSVTIHYSEPTGFPFHFHWETTVALDGTSTTTPITVEA